MPKYLVGIFTAIIISGSIIYSSFAINQNPTEINILMPAPFADSTNKIIENYNRENYGKVKVKVTRGPLETESVSDLAISSLLLGKSPFDIVLIDVTWLAKYAEAGWLLPLDSNINNNEWNTLAQGAKLGNKYNDYLYRWPLVADIGLLYWRKDLMNTPPKTPKELINKSIQLQRKGEVKYGYVWQGRQYEGLSCVFLEILSGYGGEWISNDNLIGLNSQEAIAAAKWLNELIESGVSPKAVTNYSEPETLQAFESGDSAFMRNWPYAWAELQKENSKVKGNVGVTTMVAVNKKNISSTLGSWGFSILNSSTKKDESMKVIKYLTSTDSQRKLFLQYGYTPTNIELFRDQELINHSEILPELELALNYTKARPQTPLYAQLSDVLQRQLSEIFTTDSDINKSMEIAQQNSNQILNSAGIS